jgi:hypothetical protein
MQPRNLPFSSAALDAFVGLVGEVAWEARIAEIAGNVGSGPRSAKAIRQRHGLELALERLRGPLTRAPSVAEQRAAQLAAEAVALHRRLGAGGKVRLRQRLSSALSADNTLVPLFHLLRAAALQRGRGFEVAFAGLEDGAAHDLLISCSSFHAEVACDVVSAEEGRLVHRGAWSHLMDLVEGELRQWLAANAGRHLLKITVRDAVQCGATGAVSAVHKRIRHLLGSKRQLDDAVAGLRLEPLSLTKSTDEGSLLASLRHEFGPEAHLAMIANATSLLVVAARSGRIDEVGVALRQRLTDIAPTRLTGKQPGILAMFLEDTDRGEWRGLRERLELEGEARQFLAGKAGRGVIAVTCASRFELFGAADGAEDGDLRFRNPAHPAAKCAALAPAVLSSV